jgi:hypothetical protein
MRWLWPLFCCFALPLSAQTAGPLVRAAATITAEDIQRRIGIIADDSMLGRDTPSAGLEITAQHVASEFRRAGLRPAGDSGSYFQRFGLTQWTVDTLQSVVELQAGKVRGSARVGVDARYIDGRIPTRLKGRALLLAGPTSPTKDLEDRVVLLVLDYSRPLPPNLNELVFQLAAGNPQAVLILSNRDSVTFASRLYLAGLPRLTRDMIRESAGPPVLEVHERRLVQVLAAAGIDPAELRQAGVEIRRAVDQLTVELQLHRTVLAKARVPNVVGVLEGHDPQLRHEHVAYSAHIDHIGITPGQPDSINNGADDNASGVAGLLELVEAFSQPGARPRRSLLFLAPSAEERGLLGSAHYTDHPTVPLDSIVADINMDLIGRNWPDSVIAVGPEYSDLGKTLDQVVSHHPELRMTPIADRWPEERIFYRSDHYNFARKGVPVLFFTSGTHLDYHRPSDEPERIDAEKESRLVRLLFYVGEAVANQERRPRWNADSYRQIVERQ